MKIRFLAPFLFAAIGLAAACGGDETTDPTGSGGSSAGNGGGRATATGTGGETTGSSSNTGGGGGTTTGSGMTGGSDWDAYCEGLQMCGGDAAACKAQESCAKSLLRDEIEELLFDCLSSSCDEDTCLGATFTVPLSEVGQAFAEACNDTLVQCPTFADDVCTYPYIVADDHLLTVGDCFDGNSCVEIDACFEAWADALIDNCEDWL